MVICFIAWVEIRNTWYIPCADVMASSLHTKLYSRWILANPLIKLRLLLPWNLILESRHSLEDLSSIAPKSFRRCPPAERNACYDNTSCVSSLRESAFSAVELPVTSIASRSRLRAARFKANRTSSVRSFCRLIQVSKVQNDLKVREERIVLRCIPSVWRVNLSSFNMKLRPIALRAAPVESTR